MDSTGSFTLPAVDASLQSPAIRAEDKQLAVEGQKGPSITVVIPGFKCKYCPSRFATAQGRGGHERVHRHLAEFRQNQNQKKHRRRAPAGPQPRVSSSSSHVPGLRSACFLFHPQLFNSYSTKPLHNFPSSARSGAVPLFAGGAGCLAPSQPSREAAGGGGHVGISRQVNQEKIAEFYSWFRSIAVPSFISQTQTGGGTGGLPQPSLAAPAPVAEGNGGTGDGVHLGGPQGMAEVNQEETTDGIDLTLRL